jgi:hypothetical protein
MADTLALGSGFFGFRQKCAGQARSKPTTIQPSKISTGLFGGFISDRELFSTWAE